MKMNKLALALMATLALAGCKDKDSELMTTPDKKTEGTEYCLNAQLILPELAGTRADQPEFTNGDPKEWYVKGSQVYFEFFDENEQRIGVRTPNTSWSDPNDPSTEGESVTRTSAEITISGQLKPKYVVVYLNVPDEEYSNLRRLTMKNLQTGMVSYDVQGDQHAFRPGRAYLGDENSNEKATFAKMPVAFRNMMKSYYANTDGNGSFIMMNSTYEEGGKIIRAVDISEYLYEAGTTKEQMTEKQLKGVDIYVERVVAKVNTSINLKSGAKAKDVTPAGSDTRIFEVPQMEGSQKPGSMYVEFQGWQLNGTNKSFIPLKDIGEPGDLLKMSGNGAVAVSGQGRSYWAYDLNYRPGHGDYLVNSEFYNNNGWNYKPDVRPALNYYTLSNMEALTFGKGGELGQADYCFENTMVGANDGGVGLVNSPEAVTHVLVRAQYKKKSGDSFVNIPAGENIYRWGKTIYEESEILALALQHLKAVFGDYAKDLTVADIKLVHNNKDFNAREDVKSHIICEKLIGKTYASLIRPETVTVPAADTYRATEQTGEHQSIAYYKGDVTEAVMGAATLYTFERGICYYSVPLRHFPELGHGQTGYHGVVRNHWYQVNIEDIIEFGHPATPGDPNNPGDPNKPGNDNGGDPGKPIIPEDIQDDDYALNATIKVNAWAKKPVQATIGGSQAWK